MFHDIRFYVTNRDRVGEVVPEATDRDAFGLCGYVYGTYQGCLSLL